MNRRVDYAIVGGGPAGLAVAILASLAGRRAVVIERKQGPVDKACGEGLMPPGVAWLRRMGVEIPAEQSRPFRGIRYVDGSAAAEADFVEGPGLGIRRAALSSAMQERAAALGVELRQDCEAGAFAARADHVVLQTTRGEIEARWLVGADGLHGRVRKACGFAVTTGPRRRFGMRRHFCLTPWSDVVEVHWADGVEAYVTPVGPDCVGIAFLWSAAHGRQGGYDAFLAQFPELRARLGAAARCPATAVRGAGPFDVRVKPIARDRVLLVGDASGYLDAITGEGLSLAFASAAALVAASAGEDSSAYARAWKRARHQHVALTRLVLWMARHPASRRRVVRALAEAPDVFRAFLALNTGAWGWHRAVPAAGTLGWRLITTRRNAGRADRSTAPTSASLVRLSKVSKWYDQGPIRAVVLAEVSLAMDVGQFVVVLGPSGSGKTTLLNLIGAMDTPSSGSVVVAGVDLSRTSLSGCARFRRDRIGFIFQFYNLFPNLTAAENVAAGLEVLGLQRSEMTRRTREYLDAVGLADRAGAFPAQLSGGQQQRVAIARALAKEPPLVLADEPTGNLDRETGEEVVRLMRHLNRRTGAAFIVVTHNPEIARSADRVVRLHGGKVIES